MKKVLLLMKSYNDFKPLDTALRKNDFTVYSADYANVVIQMLSAYTFDLIITEVVFDGLSATQLLDVVRKYNDSIPPIILLDEKEGKEKAGNGFTKVIKSPYTKEAIVETAVELFPSG